MDVFLLFFVLVVGAGIVSFALGWCRARWMARKPKPSASRHTQMEAEINHLYRDVSQITLAVTDLGRDLLLIRQRQEAIRKDVRAIRDLLENRTDEDAASDIGAACG